MKRLMALTLTLIMTALMASGCAGEKKAAVRVGSLSGPTTIGIANMMNDNKDSYEFTMATQPDEIASKIGAGDLDIALIPANLAASLYNKTNGGIRIIDINTLGVLYCVTGDTSITGINDLSGKTVITTGQGATPEYAVNYLLDQYNVENVTLDFKADGQEVIAALSQDKDQIAILPQPAATAATVQIEGVNTAFSLNDTWSDLNNGSMFITGVTVARKEFIEQNKEAVDRFIEDHKISADKASSDLDTTAAKTVELGIIAKEPVAKKAIPLCNIVCMSGNGIKAPLEGYLTTLFNANPKSIGGAMPGEDFYYEG